MSSDDIAISVQGLSKRYEIYDAPRDRLKQVVLPTLQRLASRPVKQYFKDFWALRDVSFEVKKGETVGIVGRNGSGKSTLLQMICGTLNPTHGHIQTVGRIAALLELGAGFNPDFTGRENIFLNGSILGLCTEEISSRLGAITAFADIGDFIEQPVKTYSSGMFVRLAFAIQANVNPEILIVDEALAVGDAYFVHRCMLRLRDLQESGTTILFVSHDANAVRNLCSRAVWLADGVVRDQGNSSKVVHAYLAHLFGHTGVASHPARNDGPTKLGSEAHLNSKMETLIPNIDGRLGSQECQIVGVGLYDESMNRIGYTLNERAVILRLTIKNNLHSADRPLFVGYIFRNSKGQEIASTNSQIEKVPIGPLPQRAYLTARLRIQLPCLHPGSYAFTVTAGYIGDDQVARTSDRVENSIVFDMLSDRRVHVMMNFPTTIEVEA